MRGMYEAARVAQVITVYLFIGSGALALTVCTLFVKLFEE